MILIFLSILTYLLGVVFVYQLLKVVAQFLPLSLLTRCVISLFSWVGISVAVLYLLFKAAIVFIVSFFGTFKCVKP